MPFGAVYAAGDFIADNSRVLGVFGGTSASGADSTTAPSPS